jgi:putative PIN family toxin of toxin-antitoxin system
MIRAVLDVNILVSSVIAPLGFPRQIFSAWRAGGYSLLISDGVIAELEEKLSLPRIARRYKATPELAVNTINLLRTEAQLIVVPVSERVRVTGDPEDDLVLATGRLGQADYLVSGDRGLLNLGQYEGTQIVTPREFVAILQSQARLTKLATPLLPLQSPL